MSAQIKKQKHVALRTCIGTGKQLPKTEMVRIVKTESGEVCIDPKGKLKGRGANLCMDPQAFEMAVKKNAFKRALKLTRNLTKLQISKLRTDFLSTLAEKTFRKGNKPVTITVSKEEFNSKTRVKDLSSNG